MNNESPSVFPLFDLLIDWLMGECGGERNMPIPPMPMAIPMPPSNVPPKSTEGGRRPMELPVETREGAGGEEAGGSDVDDDDGMPALE